MNQQGRVPFDWETRYEEWRHALSARHDGTPWLADLEEHDILFPKMRRVRRELAEREKRLREKLRLLTDDLRSFLRDGNTPKLADVGSGLIPTADFIGDQAALMEDLRIYLQNRALSEIAGATAEPRVPRDPEVPRILVDADGVLYLSEGQSAESDA